MPFVRFDFSVATGLAALAAIAFIVVRAKLREREFSLLDGLLLVILMSIAAAGGIALLEAASQTAKQATLHENLRTFRTQIEAYKAQHGGETPVLYQGGFPQLTEATNAQGVPGPPSAKHPYGPYFRSGIPSNPMTGSSVVIPTDTFPPAQASGKGGWLYHQKTGRLAIDMAEHLQE